MRAQCVGQFSKCAESRNSLSKTEKFLRTLEDQTLESVRVNWCHVRLRFCFHRVSSSLERRHLIHFNGKRRIQRQKATATLLSPRSFCLSSFNLQNNRYQMISAATTQKLFCFSFVSCHSEVIVTDHVISMQRQLGVLHFFGQPKQKFHR